MPELQTSSVSSRAVTPAQMGVRITAGIVRLAEDQEVTFDDGRDGTKI